jgi:hypothetical protein
MIKNNILDSLNSLSKTDVYSLLLFSLWKIRDIPEYSTLSELSYILDNNSLLRFLDYYGGTTISIPTKEEFKNMIEALSLYQQVDIEGKGFKEALSNLSSNINSKEVKETYSKIKEVLVKYDFKRN